MSRDSTTPGILLDEKQQQREERKKKRLVWGAGPAECHIKVHLRVNSYSLPSISSSSSLSCILSLSSSLSCMLSSVSSLKSPVSEFHMHFIVSLNSAIWIAKSFWKNKNNIRHIANIQHLHSYITLSFKVQSSFLAKDCWHFKSTTNQICASLSAPEATLLIGCNSVLQLLCFPFAELGLYQHQSFSERTHRTDSWKTEEKCAEFDQKCTGLESTTAPLTRFLQ